MYPLNSPENQGCAIIATAQKRPHLKSNVDCWLREQMLSRLREPALACILHHFKYILYYRIISFDYFNTRLDLLSNEHLKQERERDSQSPLKKNVQVPKEKKGDQSEIK